jgi:hypothetical protein
LKNISHAFFAAKSLSHEGQDRFFTSPLAPGTAGQGFAVAAFGTKYAPWCFYVSAVNAFSALGTLQRGKNDRH